MNTSRKAIEWLTCFSIVNLMLRCLLCENTRKFYGSCSLLECEMNTSRKAIEWLTCFSIVNLMLGCLLCENNKKFYESCSLLECHQHILNKI